MGCVRHQGPALGPNGPVLFLDGVEGPVERLQGLVLGPNGPALFPELIAGLHRIKARSGRAW